MNSFEATQFFTDFGVPASELPFALIMMGLASEHDDVAKWAGVTPLEVQRVESRLQESGIDPVRDCDEWEDPVNLTMALMVARGEAVRLPDGQYTLAKVQK